MDILTKGVDELIGKGIDIQKVYELKILGEPVAQARARSRMANTRDGRQFVYHYDPKKSKDYKMFIKKQIIINGAPSKLFDEPLVLSCRIYRTKPRSKPKKVLFPTTTPDLDNYIKSIKDAMRGLVYRDDSLVIGYRDIWKFYDSYNPRTEIELFRLIPVF